MVIRRIVILFLATLLTGVTHAAAQQAAPQQHTPDPNPTRLFFAPTARSLPAGGGHFGSYEVVFPNIQFGLTNRFSIGGGTFLVFGGGAEHPIWVTPKLQIVASKQLDVAVGTMHFFGIEDLNGGIAYAVATHGQPDGAVTVGAGWGYSGTNVGSAILMLGGERRMSPHTKFITENYISTKTGRGLAMFGVRLMGDRLATDFHMVTPIGADELIAFPSLNFTWKFDNK
jgi:hypothetical protein